MGLKDLLINPKAYRIGTTGQNAASKGINYPEGGRPLLGRRVTWDITDENADPTFMGLNTDHGNQTNDTFARGGMNTAFNRRILDVGRITTFLTTPAGVKFLSKQVTLQALNPRPQKIYNLGINTLASVATAGVSNIQRGGLLGGSLGKLLGLNGNTYLSEIIEDYSEANIPREINYGLGDPGKLTTKGILDKIKDLNPFQDKQGYNVSLDDSILNVDKINLLGIFQDDITKPDALESKSKDFVPFRFEVVNQDKKGSNDIIVFRAFLDNVSDDYNATHNSYKYNGRGEEFYTYNKFQRKIQVSFKVAAQTRHEMKPIYQKLNYLTAQTAPNYSPEGRIRTPYMYLTVGDWFQRIPGLITSVGLAWQKDYPWEIALDRTQEKDGIEGQDAEMLILPHVLDVNISFQPIHNFTPSNKINTPFIGINGNGYSADWISNLKSNKVDSAAKTPITSYKNPNL